MDGNHRAQDSIPTCIIPVSESSYQRLTGLPVMLDTEGKNARRLKTEQEMLQATVSKLDTLGRAACRSACGVTCALVSRYPNDTEHPEFNRLVEIFCKKPRCRTVGIVAVSAHILHATSVRKPMKQIKQLVRRR